MVEDGVYYEFYGNYAALFQNWLAVYFLLIMVPAFVFGRKVVSHLSLPRQLAVGVPVMTLLTALPFALVAESYFAYQQFMHLCRTEAALKVYQPMPAHVPGYAFDVGEDVPLSDLSKCTDQCRIALVDHGYDFVEQVSVKRPRGRNAMRRIIRETTDGYEYIPYSDESVLRVYRFFLTPVGEQGCTEESSVPAYWVPPGQPRRFCIDHETDSEIRSDRKLERNVTPQAGCCRFQVVYESISLPSGNRIAQAASYQFALASYLNFFGSVSWGRAVARFDRCTAHIDSQVRIDRFAAAVVGFPRGRL